MSIKIENVVLPSCEQWEATIRGARNPKNSWDRMDSYKTVIEDPETLETAEYEYFVGENDLDLLGRLSNGGPVHAKYRRFINVIVDITAPLYYYKELDTYKIGVACNSCSTMHKIQDKEFTLDDFSHEHLLISPLMKLKNTISELNFWRDIYNNGGPVCNFDGTARIFAPKDKDAWWQMIQLLPTTYNQRRTYMFSYEALANMYRWRKNHKLDEWREFCSWIETLPYSELITGNVKED